MKTIAAVVVRYRGGAETARCLASLRAHGGRRLEQIVLVDSGSGDGGAGKLAKQFPGVDVVGLDENRSFAWAAGIGAERTRSPYLLIANPDTEFGPGSLDRLGACLDAQPDAAGVVPLLIGPDGKPQHRWQLRRLPGCLRLALGLPGAPAFGATPEEPRSVEQPAAACWLVRREVWEALGGLDATFAPAWWEDVDFCARLAARPGLGRFWVEPAARVEHLGGSSVMAIGEEGFLAAYYGNLLRYARRHHPRCAGVVAASISLGLVVRGLARSQRRAMFLAVRRRLRRDQM